MSQYGFKVAEDLSRKHGLVFNSDLANMADYAFTEAKLTQPQANVMMELWVRCMCFAFDRTGFPLLTRIKIALYWLGFGKSLKSW